MKLHNAPCLILCGMRNPVIIASSLEVFNNKFSICSFFFHFRLRISDIAFPQVRILPCQK